MPRSGDHYRDLLSEFQARQAELSCTALHTGLPLKATVAFVGVTLIVKLALTVSFWQRAER